MSDARWPRVRASLKNTVGVIAVSVALAAGLLSAPPVAAQVQSTTGSSVTSASALSEPVKMSLAGFDAGNIISDSVFTHKSTMTASQIQSFLNSKVSKCQSGYVCLKDLKVATQTKAADKYCAKYTGASSESAATIIYKVAQACDINPQVLIVMLQKEQGLVTHTWPSDWRYNAAMGQACPDTAPCNVAFAGFFAQVYGAARQMQIYMDGVYFTWYAPGKTWNILYHPNTSCGTRPVTIANKATSALYYYTPYQPNAAALRAGYGTGDSCSSYGNRNFYNYFTDWFGSTQSAAVNTQAKLIKHGDPVYLVSGGVRFHVQKAEYSEFTAAFGQPTNVDATFVEAFRDGGQATLFLRDSSTGDVSYLRGGERHRFTSCAMVAAWGSACEQETRLASADYTRLRAGAEMSWFSKTAYSDTTMLIESGALRPVHDADTAKTLNGGTAPYAALMASSVASRYAIGPTKFVPATYLVSADSPDVLLPASDGRLAKLGAWEYSAEFGLPSTARYRGVSASALSGYSRGPDLSLFAACGDVTYAAADGKLYPVIATALSGFGVPSFDEETCAQLRLQHAGPMDRVFVQGAGRNEVYLAQSGVYRHVTTRAAMNEITGGVWPSILVLSAATIDKLPKGDRILQTGGGSMPAGEFVRTEKSTEVWLPLAGDIKVYLPSWTVAAELGLPQRQKTVSSAILDKFPAKGQLGLFVGCEGQMYAASQGRLYPAAADASAGFSTVSLDEATCRMLNRVEQSTLGAVYVQGIGRDEVYAAQNGVYRHVTSRNALLTLNGGSWPQILPIGPSTVQALPKGSPIR